MRSAVPVQSQCVGDHPPSAETMGEPVWCQAHAEQIFDAIGSLPSLAAQLWELGHEAVEDVHRVVDVDDVPSRAPDRVWRGWVLSCGHRTPRQLLDPLTPRPDSAPCWQCAIDHPGSDGRLMPGEQSGRRGPRRLGSPAGSPARLAIDEILAWAITTRDYLAARLPVPSTPTPDWRNVSDQRRAAALAECTRFLVEHGWELLATPHARAIGREAVDLCRRMQRASGTAAPKPTPVPSVPCPACDLCYLERLPSSLLIRCRSCLAQFDDRQVLPDE